MARNSAARRLGGKSVGEGAGRPDSTSGRRAAGHSQALDRIIHERVRLGIVSALAVNRSLAFNELKALLGVTDGNLSVHARRLEEAGYVECAKSFAGRVPRTEFRLTGRGREALERYLAHMEGLIRTTRGR